MEKFMTIREVAELIRYQEDTIRLFVRSGQLKAYRRKAKQSELRFKISDIEAFMDGKTSATKKKKIEKRR
ncbi:hypothetical protein ES703_49204 [subsurface metagenome]